MDDRLDPACAGAKELVKRHEDQAHLLLTGFEGPLADVLRATQTKQIVDHLVQCARCRHFDPRCEACGFDLRRERHGWRCARQASRWRDVFPWNWRARLAPAQPKRGFRHVQTRETSPAPQVRPAAPQVRPAAPQARPGDALARPDARHAAPRGTPHAQQGGPKPRARPHAPKPGALSLAYAVLGLSPDADPEAVRLAYRSRAQQYHPDKVTHLAPEFRQLADQKMSEINSAYDKIKRHLANAR